jgi:hypothetical protein
MPAKALDKSDESQVVSTHPLETPPHPPRVSFGPIFTVRKTACFAMFPPPDAIEIKRSAELAHGLRNLTARLLNLESERLDVEFGMTGCNPPPAQRYCFQVMVPGWNTVDPALIDELQRSIANFLQGIAGKKSGDQSDLDMPAIEENTQSMVDMVVQDFIADHPESRYPAGMTVSGGKNELAAPTRIAARPPREEITIPSSTVGLVDELGRSSRRLKIKMANNKVVNAKFDVDEHLEVLCRQLRDQSMCKSELECHVDPGGKETVTLISTQELQPRLPGT